MGRSALILVLMLGAVFGIIGVNINSTNSRIAESQSGYYKYSFARNLARVGVNRTLRFCDQNMQNPAYLPPGSGSFNGGSYAIQFARTGVNVGDTISITSTGVCADSSYTMNIRLRRTVQPYPKAHGAIGITAPLQSISFKNNKTHVDGLNHDISGTTLTGDGNGPGIAVLSGGDSTKVAAAGGGAGSIVGDPTIKVDSTQTNPIDYIQQYSQWADYSYNLSNAPGGNATLGTIDAPKITVIDAGTDTTKKITLNGSVSGCGILVIKGDVKLAGNFSFTGLVIFAGVSNSFENISSTGTASIVGGIMLAGAGASLSMGGNTTVDYSKEALDNTQNKVSQLQFYDILDWFE